MNNKLTYTRYLRPPGGAAAPASRLRLPKAETQFRFSVRNRLIRRNPAKTQFRFPTKLSGGGEGWSSDKLWAGGGDRRRYQVDWGPDNRDNKSKIHPLRRGCW